MHAANRDQVAVATSLRTPVPDTRRRERETDGSRRMAAQSVRFAVVLPGIRIVSRFAVGDTFELNENDLQ
jgi:hypothetical protein